MVIFLDVLPEHRPDFIQDLPESLVTLDLHLKFYVILTYRFVGVYDVWVFVKISKHRFFYFQSVQLHLNFIPIIADFLEVDHQPVVLYYSVLFHFLYPINHAGQADARSFRYFYRADSGIRRQYLFSSYFLVTGFAIASLMASTIILPSLGSNRAGEPLKKPVQAWGEERF